MVQGEVSFHHFPGTVLSPQLVDWLFYRWSLCWSRTRSAVCHGALSPANPAAMSPPVSVVTDLLVRLPEALQILQKLHFPSEAELK